MRKRFGKGTRRANKRVIDIYLITLIELSFLTLGLNNSRIVVSVYYVPGLFIDSKEYLG
jgi:hypothetical protein